MDLLEVTDRMAALVQRIVQEHDADGRHQSSGHPGEFLGCGWDRCLAEPVGQALADLVKEPTVTRAESLGQVVDYTGERIGIYLVDGVSA